MRYSMSEKERGRAFPIHVEMGDDGPVLDLGEHAAAVNLPDKGCVLVDYEKLDDGGLLVKTVCLPGKGATPKPTEDEPDDLAAALGNEARMDAEQGNDEDDDDEE